jgi:hypothetical protein
LRQVEAEKPFCKGIELLHLISRLVLMPIARRYRVQKAWVSRQSKVTTWGASGNRQKYQRLRSFENLGDQYHENEDQAE